MGAGERVTIVQTEGHQVGDLVAFNGDDLTEFLSPSHTRRCLNAIRLTPGASLFTNHREPILDLVEDTVGVHDFLAPACDPYRYRRDFGVEDHPDYHQPTDTADRIGPRFFGDAADMVIEAMLAFDAQLK